MRTVVMMFWVLSTVSAQQQKAWYDALPVTWGAPTEGWQVAVFTEKQSYYSDEPTDVMLVAHNASATRASIEKPKSPWHVADFTVRSLSDGKVVGLRPPRDHAERLSRFGMGSTLSHVEPGGTTRY